jgi:hypothetical protein
MKTFYTADQQKKTTAPFAMSAMFFRIVFMIILLHGTAHAQVSADAGVDAVKQFGTAVPLPVIKQGLKGQITDERGEGLICASLVILDQNGKKTGRGVKADFDGNYEFELEPGKYNIMISYIGYSSKVINDVIICKDQMSSFSSNLEPMVREEPVICYYCCRRYCFRDDEKEKSREADEPKVTNLRAYPVPLSASATLEYKLKDAEAVSISLVDIEGRTVSTLMPPQMLEEGAHKDTYYLPAALPSGVYFITLKKASGDQVLKVLK